MGEFIHQEKAFGRVEPQTYFMLLMEFCPRGDLKRIIDRQYRNLTEQRVGVLVSALFSLLLCLTLLLHPSLVPCFPIASSSLSVKFLLLPLFRSSMNVLVAAAQYSEE